MRRDLRQPNKSSSPLDPVTGDLVAGDIKVQTDRVLQNVKAILDDQGLTFANVVKSTVFATNAQTVAAGAGSSRWI